MSSGPPNKRFAQFSDDEYDRKLRAAENASTKGQEKRATSFFQEFLRLNSEEDTQEFWAFDDATLDKWLGHFYLKLRKEDGKRYKLNSMTVMKSALQRVLKDKGKPVDISGPAFPVSSKAWRSLELELKKEGLATTENAPEINEAGRSRSRLHVKLFFEVPCLQTKQAGRGGAYIVIGQIC